MNIAVKSLITLTMGYAKYGHYFNDGLNNTGTLEILDIGFASLTNSDYNINQIIDKDLKSKIKLHSNLSHKYSKGKVGIYAGSKGMTGAAILSAKSAERIGSGIIKLITPSSLNAIYEEKLINIITVPISDGNKGFLSIDKQNDIQSFIEWADALCCGPGLSVDDESQKLIATILQEFNKPLVLDASGFEPIINGKLKISDLPKKTIMSPHYKEFSRIFNIDLKIVIADPIACCKKVVSILNGRVLILKGPTTIIVSSTGSLFIMTNGKPILATAGTGDVLSGILVGLLVQQYSIDDCAIIATYLHAEVGNDFVYNISDIGMLASDMIDFLPSTLQRIMDVD